MPDDKRRLAAARSGARNERAQGGVQGEALASIKPPSEGELEVLSYVTEHPDISVRDVAAEFARTRGLARTTVLTLMERLRSKGYLTRKRVDAVWVYRAREKQGHVLSRLVERFVEKTLGGSLQPFVAYLLDKPQVSKEELAELRELVESLDAKNKEDGK